MCCGVCVCVYQRDKEKRRNDLRRMAEENKRMMEEKEKLLVRNPHPSHLYERRGNGGMGLLMEVVRALMFVYTGCFI